MRLLRRFHRHAFVPGLPGMILALGAVSCHATSSGGSSQDTASRSAVAAPARMSAVDTAATDAPSPSQAAPAASGVEYYAAATLTHVGDSLSRTPRTGDVLRGHTTFQTIELRRAANGVPEVHDRWTDVMIFQSGKAAVLLGGRVSGSQVTAPGEHRGGTIDGGHPQPVGPGDLLVIPAGTPHQIQIARGDSLRYITVKVPAEH